MSPDIFIDLGNRRMSYVSTYPLGMNTCKWMLSILDGTEASCNIWWLLACVWHLRSDAGVSYLRKHIWRYTGSEEKSNGVGGLKVAVFCEFLLQVDTSQEWHWGEGGSHEGPGSFSKAITLYQEKATTLYQDYRPISRQGYHPLSRHMMFMDIPVGLHFSLKEIPQNQFLLDS